MAGTVTRTAPITTDLVSIVHPDIRSAYTPMEYSTLHFRKYSALVARITRRMLIPMVYHALHRKLKYDKSTKSYLYSSRLKVFPANRKWMEIRSHDLILKVGRTLQ